MVGYMIKILAGKCGFFCDRIYIPFVTYSSRCPWRYCVIITVSGLSGHWVIATVNVASGHWVTVIFVNVPAVRCIFIIENTAVWETLLQLSEGNRVILTASYYHSEYDIRIPSYCYDEHFLCYCNSKFSFLQNTELLRWWCTNRAFGLLLW